MFSCCKRKAFIGKYFSTNILCHFLTWTVKCCDIELISSAYGFFNWMNFNFRDILLFYTSFCRVYHFPVRMDSSKRTLSPFFSYNLCIDILFCFLPFYNVIFCGAFFITSSFLWIFLNFFSPDSWNFIIFRCFSIFFLYKTSFLSVLFWFYFFHCIYRNSFPVPFNFGYFQIQWLLVYDFFFPDSLDNLSVSLFTHSSLIWLYLFAISKWLYSLTCYSAFIIFSLFLSDIFVFF